MTFFPNLIHISWLFINKLITVELTLHPELTETLYDCHYLLERHIRQGKRQKRKTMVHFLTCFVSFSNWLSTTPLENFSSEELLHVEFIIREVMLWVSHLEFLFSEDCIPSRMFSKIRSEMIVLAENGRGSLDILRSQIYYLQSGSLGKTSTFVRVLRRYAFSFKHFLNALQDVLSKCRDIVHPATVSECVPPVVIESNNQPAKVDEKKTFTDASVQCDLLPKDNGITPHQRFHELLNQDNVMIVCDKSVREYYFSLVSDTVMTQMTKIMEIDQLLWKGQNVLVFSIDFCATSISLTILKNFL